MRDVNEGDLLWTPSEEVIENANLTHYMRWLAQEHGRSFSTYADLWHWSVTDLAGFWRAIWDYFDVVASQPPDQILADRTMPGAKWFPGARLNYAENILAKMKAAGPVITYQAEDRPLIAISRRQIVGRVSALAQALRRMGVQKGDRVAAYVSHIPEAIVGLLATASLGAIWSSCSPDFGSRSVLDRFSQIEPKILLAVDGYRYGGKAYHRLDVVGTLQESLPTLEKTILIPQLAAAPDLSGLSDVQLWDDVLAPSDADAEIPFTQVPFDHPLWVLYSSGTTGLPKPIVHGHGGIVLEHAKELGLHMDLKPADRFFWYTSTGWMMWNYLIGATLTGASIIVYNGSPGYPDMNRLWALAEETGMTYFGTSAAFIHACMKEEIHPNQTYDLSRIRAVGSTGSPLSPAGFGWVYDNVNASLALESFSGGTDLCTGFVGGIRTQPIYAGEIQGASLGARVQAFNEDGEPVVGDVGELVITEPMPSMPIYFWDDENNERYKSSYFEMFPGVWRHGDWIKFNERGGCVIYGRSDATINRQGVRMGTSEIYRVVEALPEIVDSLVIDLEALGRESYMPLFVVLREGAALDDALRQRIRQRLRDELSPRHVPSDIFVIDEVPYTLSGKKMEVPIRKILLGQPVEKAAKRGAMRNPETLKFFIALSERLQG